MLPGLCGPSIVATQLAHVLETIVDVDVVVAETVVGAGGSMQHLVVSISSQPVGLLHNKLQAVGLSCKFEGHL